MSTPDAQRERLDRLIERAQREHRRDNRWQRHPADTFINAGAALSPSNSIGTITVQGNLTLVPGATYAVEVSPTAADRTNVTGTANLAGTVIGDVRAGSYMTRVNTILSAGSRNGTFSSLTSVNLPAGFQADLTYVGNNVQLIVTGALSTAGLPINPQNVANAMNNYFNNGGTLPAGFVAAFGLSGNALVNGMGQLSGEVGAATAQSGTQMMNAFLSQMLNPYAGAPGGNVGSVGYARAFAAADSSLPQDAADAYAAAMPVKGSRAFASVKEPSAFADRWSTWGQAYGGAGTTNGEASVIGSHDTSSRIAGVAAGMDYRVTRETLVGFALSGGETSWGLAQGLGSGKGDVFQAGVYASHRSGPAFVSAALAYSWYDMTTDRTLTISGADVLRARFQANNIGARLETGYRAGTSAAAVTPYAAAQVQNFRTPSYAETVVSGSPQFALAYRNNSVTATRLEAGYWLDTLVAFTGNHTIALRGRAAWAYDAGNSGKPAQHSRRCRERVSRCWAPSPRRIWRCSPEAQSYGWAMVSRSAPRSMSNTGCARRPTRERAYSATDGRRRSSQQGDVRRHPPIGGLFPKRDPAPQAGCLFLSRPAPVVLSATRGHP